MRFLCSFREADLIEPVTFLLGGDVIVFRDRSGAILATRNQCRHRGGRFKYSGTCVLTCQNHGWQLDVSKMEYVNPISGITQDRLIVEKCTDGALAVFEVLEPGPWEIDPGPVLPLSPGEFVARFYANA